MHLAMPLLVDLAGNRSRTGWNRLRFVHSPLRGGPLILLNSRYITFHEESSLGRAQAEAGD